MEHISKLEISEKSNKLKRMRRETMIKVYKIKVAEKVYEVEVEAITEKEGKIASSAPAAVPAPAAKDPEAYGEGTKIEAPMQGKILDVVVSVGSKVKAGETLIVIEAMKMENPIVAPCDGTITSISINKGDMVDGGDILATIA